MYQLIFIFVNHEWTHHKVIESLQAALARVELALAFPYKLGFCERLLHVNVIFTSLHSIRMNKLFVLRMMIHNLL
jgi:hypothetical protein